MKTDRLKGLERRARALLAEDSVVEVVFSDGTSRTMPAPEVIPLFHSPAQIVSVTGGNAGDGRLVELLAGLIGDAPEVNL